MCEIEHCIGADCDIEELGQKRAALSHTTAYLKMHAVVPCDMAYVPGLVPKVAD